MKYFSRVCTWKDSPELVDVETVEDARRTMSPETFAREWECDFDSAEGLVLAFDTDFHVRTLPDIRMCHRFALGVDHGWEDPGCFLFCGIQGKGEDATLWILDEVYEQHKPNHEWDTIARQRFQGVETFPDPSRPDRIHDLKKAGLVCRDVDNAIEAGVARLASLLAIREDESGNKWSRLYVQPNCVNFIREVKAYRRKADPHNAGRFLEAIEDKNNHAIDPARYVAMGIFGPLQWAGNRRSETAGA